MKLRSKFSLLTGGIFLGAVLVSALSVWTMSVTSRLSATINDGNELIGTALRLHGLMTDMMFDLFTPQTYRLLKDVLHTPRFQSTQGIFRASMAEFESSMEDFMQSPGVRGLLRDQELRDAYDTAEIMKAKASDRIRSFQSTIDTLYASGLPGDTDMYRELQSSRGAEISQFFDEVRETSYYLTYSFESFLTHFIRSLQEESAIIRRQFLIAFWSVTALVGAAMFVASFLFASRISSRIRSIEDGVRAISRGDFGARLSIRTSDEFGDLARQFDLFMKELKKNIDTIQSLMRDVSESLASRPSYRRILDLIAESAVHDTNADGAAVIVTDPVQGLVVASSAGSFPLPVGVVPVAESAAGPGAFGIRIHDIVEQGQPVFVHQRCTLAEGHDVQSFMALPLVTTQGTLGLLCVAAAAPQASLSDLDFTTFRSFADYAALILDNFFKYKELLEKRDAEYRALQSQIQPHFLYNVLNGFVGLNRLGDTRSLESAIFSLKDMLRYILDGSRWTTVGDELAFLGRYCELQRLRFQERLVVSIRCDEAAAGVRIPKLILQPIVENAVIHGIEPLDRPGHLEIAACLDGDNGTRTARITVSDDGAGYSPGADETVERIGLTNVRERLLIASPEARLAIVSGPGKGTRIALEIPVARGDDEDTHL